MKTAMEYLALAEKCRERALEGGRRRDTRTLLGAAAEFRRLAEQELDKARETMRAPFRQGEDRPLLHEAEHAAPPKTGLCGVSRKDDVQN